MLLFWLRFGFPAKIMREGGADGVFYTPKLCVATPELVYKFKSVVGLFFVVISDYFATNDYFAAFGLRFVCRAANLKIVFCHFILVRILLKNPANSRSANTRFPLLAHLQNGRAKCKN